ncbi:MAG: 23S rRNA (adenine(1618)-N(6))-methyltransferase RlmF [Spirochaetales bacterium]|nr:23S rRNA (adenine(1618)-N(6))-methyltransferase RlmF [Spirochaetales bacterium]
MAKGTLHPRNPHSGRYDFTALTISCPPLQEYIKPNPAGDNTIDFSDAGAVLCLNKALLAHYYNIMYYQIPSGYLCPPIPGRADYIHYAADLLSKCTQGSLPRGTGVKVLDIGTGANCIYSIIGSQSYGWQFTATDTDSVAIKAAGVIVESNPCLHELINLVEQKDKDKIFIGVIRNDDRFSLTICNPPFHSSVADAEAVNQRKWGNLNKNKSTPPLSLKNFGGQSSELCYPGGEITFLRKMIKESAGFAQQVCWFTSLVSKSDNILLLKKMLNSQDVKQIEVINMQQGQKTSRFIAWSFMTVNQQKSWAQDRWN